MAAHFATGQYSGFDFAENTISTSRFKGLDVWKGDVYDPSSYDSSAPLYTLIEVIEHIDGDMKVIEGLPAGKDLVITVPSFDDPGHVRTYSEEFFRLRYESLLEIDRIRRFGLLEGTWIEGHPGEPFILFAECRRKENHGTAES
jgi:hypothetical protein